MKVNASQLFSYLIFLQRVILIFIFGKIQCFHFLWNTLTGIVFKSAAFVIYSAHPLPGTEDLPIFQMGTIKTVCAGTFDFLPKQHGGSLLNSVSPLYTNCFLKATAFFPFQKKMHENGKKSNDRQAGTEQNQTANPGTESCLD